jgi:hypothetical protein
MDFADAINQIKASIDGNYWEIQGFVTNPELFGFDKQETDMPLLSMNKVKTTGF